MKGSDRHTQFCISIKIVFFFSFRSTSSLSEFHNFNETVLISNMTEVNQALLQPICKLNSVMMETLKQEDGTFEVVISGSEINVKRAKLQLEHFATSPDVPTQPFLKARGSHILEVGPLASSLACLLVSLLNMHN